MIKISKDSKIHETLYLILVGVCEDKHTKHNVNMMENIHTGNNLSLRSPELCDTGLRKVKCKLVYEQGTAVAFFSIITSIVTFSEFHLKILIACRSIT